MGVNSPSVRATVRIVNASAPPPAATWTAAATTMASRLRLRRRGRGAGRVQVEGSGEADQDHGPEVRIGAFAFVASSAFMLLHPRFLGPNVPGALLALGLLYVAARRQPRARVAVAQEGSASVAARLVLFG